MTYFSVSDTNSISGFNGTDYCIFADSENDNAFSTKLEDGTVVELFMLMSGFMALGVTDGKDFVIESELIADQGLVIAFDTDGNTNYIGNYYGANSTFNALFGEYFGISSETRHIVIETNGGSNGEVHVLPRPTGTQAQNFRVSSGISQTNYINLAASEDGLNDVVVIEMGTSSGVGISLTNDTANDINSIVFSSTTDNEIISNGNLLIDITGAATINVSTDILISADDDLTLFSTAGDILIDSEAGGITVESATYGNFHIVGESFIYGGATGFGSNYYFFKPAESSPAGDMIINSLGGVNLLAGTKISLNGLPHIVPGSLDSYVDNAAATLGGLDPGDLYFVTGSDPGQIAIVF